MDQYVLHAQAKILPNGRVYRDRVVPYPGLSGHRRRRPSSRLGNTKFSASLPVRSAEPAGGDLRHHPDLHAVDYLFRLVFLIWNILIVLILEDGMEAPTRQTVRGATRPTIIVATNTVSSYRNSSNSNSSSKRTRCLTCQSCADNERQTV